MTETKEGRFLNRVPWNSWHRKNDRVNVRLLRMKKVVNKAGSAAQAYSLRAQSNVRLIALPPVFSAAVPFLPLSPARAHWS